ncbi:MAG: helix-turn-helix transcriptional regulator [Bacteroidota bacterium]
MKNKEFKDLVSSEESKVHELIKFRKQNKQWLKKSMLIAIAILKALREKNITQIKLAEDLNVTPQYINKILKGSENLTLETIVKIEDALKIKLISIEAYHYQGAVIKPTGVPMFLNRASYKPVVSTNKIEERKTFDTLKQDFSNAA